MLEGLVSGILSNLLGSFLDDFSQHQLNIELLSGTRSSFLSLPLLGPLIFSCTADPGNGNKPPKIALKLCNFFLPFFV